MPVSTEHPVIQSRRWYWRDALLVVVICAALLVSLRGHVWQPGRGWSAYTPAVVSGDEPHYLMLINSVLLDGDLSLSEDYRAVERGELRAGNAFAGLSLDHHTWVVDPATGQRALWSSLYDWRHPRHCDADDRSCRRWKKLDARLPESSQTRVEGPAHPPAHPILVAASLAPWVDRPDLVETNALRLSVLWVLATLLAVSALAAAFGLGRLGQLTVLTLTLVSPLSAYSRGLFSEPVAALTLVLGVLCWRRNRPLLSALILAFAAAIKPPWALIGIALMWRGWDTKRAQNGFRLCYGLSGVAIVMANFAWISGPIISGQLGWQFIHEPSQLMATLIDGRHGLLTFTPWCVLALPALWRNPALAVLTPALALLLVTMMLFGSLGEVCFGPRLWLPVVPLLAVAAVRSVHEVSVRSKPMLRRWLVLCGMWSLLAAWPGIVAWPMAWEQPAYAMVRLGLRVIMAH